MAGTGHLSGLRKEYKLLTDRRDGTGPLSGLKALAQPLLAHPHLRELIIKYKINPSGFRKLSDNVAQKC